MDSIYPYFSIYNWVWNFFFCKRIIEVLLEASQLFSVATYSGSSPISTNLIIQQDFEIEIASEKQITSNMWTEVYAENF